MTQSNSCDYSEPTKVRRGMYLMIKNFPCRVTNIAFFKSGKHGCAKYRFDGFDIFTDKKCVETFISGDRIKMPIVQKNQYTLINIGEDDFLSLMDEIGEVREDIDLPGDTNLRDNITQAFDNGKNISITVLTAMNNDRVIEFVEERD
jgi:translation initiation factor 5A